MTGFYVSSGLLTPEHRRRMSSAIWEFLWLIDHETRTDGKVSDGKVLKGAPITINRIAQELGKAEKNTRSKLDRLVEQGYITREGEVGAAYRYTITNSKKWLHDPPTPVENDRTTPRSKTTGPPVENDRTPRSKTTDPPRSKTTGPPVENDRANKDIDSSRHKSRQRETGGEEEQPPTPTAPPSPSLRFSPDDATKVLEAVHLPSAAGNLEAARLAVECEIKAGLSAEEAVTFIVAGCQAAAATNHAIDKFFLEDAKYRSENRKKPSLMEKQIASRNGARELLRKKLAEEGR